MEKESEDSIPISSPLLVVDGQQRLTTIILLIAALANSLRQLEDLSEPVKGLSPQKLRNYFLVNEGEKGESYYKLLLSETDKDTLIAILNNTDTSDLGPSRVRENFDLFQDLIAAKKVNFLEIYKGLAKLVIIEIMPDYGKDSSRFAEEILGFFQNAVAIRSINVPPIASKADRDISRRKALEEFDRLLGDNTSEPDWQRYFEANHWVFGLGLNLVFLRSVGAKLETRTTGNSFDRPGKTVDALFRTGGAVSQYALVEIKRSNTALLEQSYYRGGCWGVSSEVSNAVTQIQKTTFEFG